MVAVLERLRRYTLDAPERAHVAEGLWGVLAVVERGAIAPIRRKDVLGVLRHPLHRHNRVDESRVLRSGRVLLHDSGEENGELVPHLRPIITVEERDGLPDKIERLVDQWQRDVHGVHSAHEM